VTIPNSDVIYAMGYINLGKQGNWLATVPVKGYFARPQALRPDGSSNRQELETRRYRKGTVTLQRRFLDNPAGRCV